uniref:Uncharacterized protein n=1 Tax=Anguilla anguilla TaxID=7936 RepID=A0A0E9UAP7_ANGAN
MWGLKPPRTSLSSSRRIYIAGLLLLLLFLSAHTTI